VATGLKNRGGVSAIFIVCVDGLKGFPEAFEAVFPNSVYTKFRMPPQVMKYVPTKRKSTACLICRNYFSTHLSKNQITQKN
jgi:putative transposase